MHQLVILDRDGVINHDRDDYIKSVHEWQPINGSLPAIARLNQAGYGVAVATNQSGIARGYYNLGVLRAIHHKMHRMLARYGGLIESVYFCPHHPQDGCQCRKPQPGLLHQAISEHYTGQQAIDQVYFIGDSCSDLQAALAVGCQPILVKTGYGYRALSAWHDMGRPPVFENLAHAVDGLLVA